MIFINILGLFLGFGLLVKGADWFVEGAAGIARKMGIPQLVIGLTIVAMGTSAPEAAVSINAALKGNAAITIGNIVGSNILNILIILGITALIMPLKVQPSCFKIDIPYMIGITFVLIFLGYTGEYVTRIEGGILLILFIAYLSYLFVLTKKSDEAIDETSEHKMMTLVLYALIGIVIIVWGSDLTVDCATRIAQQLGVSERFIGLTIVAFGTSLPELVTSVIAARKGNADIAIGNIIGSNIFNILFIVGITSVITPVLYENKFLIDGFVAVGAGVLLLLSIRKYKELRKGWGIIFLLAYSLYFCYLLF